MKSNRKAFVNQQQVLVFSSVTNLSDFGSRSSLKNVSGWLRAQFNLFRVFQSLTLTAFLFFL